LRIGLGQTSENLEWFLDGAQDAILDLPTGAILSGLPGQPGLGGNLLWSERYGAKQCQRFRPAGLCGFALPGSAKLRLGRFTFLERKKLGPSRTAMNS